ncbi:MAG: type II toxin-antitoxin system VapC family toxin [Rhizobiales bacterium]|nr:type II toxin-antitoxin system VapC family toxin [Hyphomicrobiales bacterium]
MFIDASAMVAIITKEPGNVALSRAIDSAAQCITSPLAIWETASGISRKARSAARLELPVIEEFLQQAEIAIETVDMGISRAALDAFDRYGRGSGHPAQLNMGDCFAYAFAKNRGVSLLYVGNDFTQTDVMRAIA